MKRGKSELPDDFREVCQRIIEHGTDDIFLIDKDLTLQFVNPHAASRLNKKPKDAIGIPLKDYFPPTVYPRLEKALKEVLKTGNPKTTEDEFVFVDESVWLNTTLLPIKEKGKTTSVIGVSRDVTDRKEAEQAVKDSTSHILTITDNAQDCIFRKNRKRRYTFVNPAMQELLELPKDEILGKKPTDIFGKEQAAIIDELDARTFRGEIVDETRELSIQGKPYVFHALQTPIRDEKGNITEIMGVVRDVTEEYLMRKSLTDREENFRALAENANDAIIVLTAEGKPLFANERAAEMSGYEQGELLQKTIKDFVPKDQLKTLTQRLKKRIDGGEVPRNYESSLLHKDGHTFPVEITGSRTEWHGEAADLIIIRDITERKQAEDALKKERDFSNKIIQTAPTYFFAIDAEGKILMMNEAFFSALGYSPFEVVGEDHRMFVPDDAKDQATQEFKRALSSPEPHVIEIEVGKKNGELLIVQWHGRGIFDEDGDFEFAFAIGIDVTEKRKHEKEIQKLSAFRERLLRDAPVGIFTTDREGNMTSANPRLVEILGSPGVEETLKFNLLSLEAIKKAGATEALHKVLIKGEPISIKSLPYQSHWGKKSTLSLQASPLGGKDRGIEGMLGIVEDISERRRLEEKLSRAQTKKIPLTRKEQEVLYHLTCDPHRNDREISEDIGIERSTITAIRNRLLSRGFFRKIHVPSFTQLGCGVLAIVQGRYRPDKDPAARAKIVSAEKLDATPELVICYQSESEEFMVYGCKDKRDFDRVYEDIQGRYEAGDCYDTPPTVTEVAVAADHAPYAFDPSRLLGQTLSIAQGPHPAAAPTGISKLTRKEKLVYTAMVEYPMFNNTQIAEKIKVSRRKVSQTKQKLYDNDLLAPLILPDLGLIGIEMLVFSRGHYLVSPYEGSKIRETIEDALPLVAVFGSGREEAYLMGFPNYTDYKGAFEEVVGRLKAENRLHRDPETTVVPIDSLCYTKWDFTGLVKKHLSTSPFA